MNKNPYTAMENKWRDLWFNSSLFHWDETNNTSEVYSIDTPPPSVSGHLHMGHIFSYCHADFIARYQRMSGKNVFYPIGFDDNGLPTERLAEKTKGVRGITMARNGRRDEFVALCEEVVQEAEITFEDMFKAIGLSVDWGRKYQTISKESAKVGQSSFLELYKKGLIYRAYAPVYWDIIDRTAVAQAEILDNVLDSEACNVLFSVHDCNGQAVCTNDSIGSVEIMTTRPEMLPACVAVFYHPEDTRYNGDGMDEMHSITREDGSIAKIRGMNLFGMFAKVPIISLYVPLLADFDVQKDKGTGLVMCCSYGDWQDVEWIRRHRSSIDDVYIDSTSGTDLTSIKRSDVRIIISDLGRIPIDFYCQNWYKAGLCDNVFCDVARYIDLKLEIDNNFALNDTNSYNIQTARDVAISNLVSIDALIGCAKIKHAVKCAERSGASMEILHKHQWYVDLGFRENRSNMNSDVIYGKSISERSILNDAQSPEFRCDENSDIVAHKNSLQSKILAHASTFKRNLLKIVSYIDFHPDHMKNHLIQWIEGLNQDWCISRDRFFGVLIPQPFTENLKYSDFPLSTTQDLLSTLKSDIAKNCGDNIDCCDIQVFDTWFISSVSPQLNTGVINEKVSLDAAALDLHRRLFPMNLRPQSHEIIRTWTFYTCVKAYLHAVSWHDGQWTLLDKNNEVIDLDHSDQVMIRRQLIENGVIPWTKVMCSGWCLAADKRKMSKSKGNVITPMSVIEANGADVVRYWASTANLGSDTTYNDAKFRDAKRLINKIQSVGRFCEMYFDKMSHVPIDIASDIEAGIIFETSDLWIITCLYKAAISIGAELERCEYYRAREIIENFFWHDFCDNYIEIIKARIYGPDAFVYQNAKYKFSVEKIHKKQQSAIMTMYHVFDIVLHFFAPFIPFVCEDLYQHLFVKSAVSDKIKFDEYSIHRLGSWPKLQRMMSKESDIVLSLNLAAKHGSILIDIISAVRQYKALHNLSVKAPIIAMSVPCLPSDLEFDLRCVCNALDACINIDTTLSIKH